MIQIDDKIISLDIFERKFCCDIPKCKGACCVHGDSGAPLEEYEVDQLIEALPEVLPYLTDKSREAIEREGIPVVDSDGDLVTPLVQGAECAFVVVEDGITLCGIEKAWIDKKVDFRKPISCALYPIRVKKYADFEALNYDIWDICKHARRKGEKLGLPIYKFLKDPIITKYGETFYNEMEEAYKLLQKNPDIKL
ncbi:MAG: DUF3109 family protein [Bacteroidales bacterium]|jgi:hypothetical protein|nr:DUF3109 family protein [Bacteroidales bacterium]